MKKIDIFNHVMPPAYLELVKQHSKDPGIVKRMTSLRMLWDIEARVEMLAEQFPDVRQVLTLGAPAPELPRRCRPVAGDSRGSRTTAWRRSASAGRDQFPAFVASLPMNNVPAALKEMDRAIDELGARGVQIITNVNGRPLDDPEFFPVFERMANKHDLPIWMHPLRAGNRRRLPRRAEVQVRDLAGARLALRDQRRRWRAWCSRGCWRGCRSCASSRTIAAA